MNGVMLKDKTNPLQFDPERIISKEEFSSIFRLEDGLEVGDLLTPPTDHLTQFMQLWVSRMDDYILKARQKDLKPFVELLTRYRAFTYEEFTLLFKSIPEEKFKHYPIFQFLRIPSVDYLEEYRLGLDNDETSYLQILLEAAHDLDGLGIDFFLRKLKTKIPIREFMRHGYICGATGSGKSELMRLLLHHLTKQSKDGKYSFVLIDPHGDASWFSLTGEFKL